jgi:hypothetical protein
VDVAAWAASPDPLEAAVTDVATLARHAMALRTRLRRASGEPEGDATFDESLPSSEPVGLVGKVIRRVRQL